jgi:hypothetical protein
MHAHNEHGKAKVVICARATVRKGDSSEIATCGTLRAASRTNRRAPRCQTSYQECVGEGSMSLRAKSALIDTCGEHGKAKVTAPFSVEAVPIATGAMLRAASRDTTCCSLG